MQVSYKWLSEYVDLTKVTPEELADKMSRTGIEIEEVKYLNSGLKKIIVGEVVECVDHPNSDHLHICQVNIGDEITQIVCGAPNVAKGQKVIVALPGARIVDNVKIKKGKIRGEISNGMLCSLEELGVDNAVIPKEESDGIYILPADSVVGEDALPLVEMDDAILDLAITPNRADALSMRGVSYEVAAIYNQEMHFPSFSLQTTKMPNPLQAQVDVHDMVPTYAVRYIKGLQVQESPKWLQFKLMHAGIRPVNNVVDVTNYILLMFGEPLHAYDASKIDGNLTVRYACDKENFQALNEEEYVLQSTDLVVADNNGPVALAGVMGGLATSVTKDTVDVYLEAALFDEITIRKTSQRHHLRTDASQRFEKGVDHNMVLQALDAACAMLVELAGGQVAEDLSVACLEEVEEETITIDLQRINHLLGIELTAEDVSKILKSLQFKHDVIEDEIFVITIPSRRFDIHIEADIIEEIGRLYGYDNLPNVLPTLPLTPGKRTPKQTFIKRTRQGMCKLGLQETINYALTTEEKATDFDIDAGDVIKLDWPMSVDRSVMRRNLVSGLLDTFQYNVARKNNNLTMYEIGNVFTKMEKYHEETHLALALTGEMEASLWQKDVANIDFYTIKGMVDEYLHKLSLAETISYRATSNRNSMHPYQTADIYVGDTLIGYVGAVHPNKLKELDLMATYVAEINLELLLSLPKKDEVAQEISKYPAVTRDIAMLVDNKVANSDIEQAIWNKGGKVLRSIALFDVYTGTNIDDNQKSMAYTLTFQKDDSTLTDEEIENVMTKITNNLIDTLNVEIR